MIIIHFIVKYELYYFEYGFVPHIHWSLVLRFGRLYIMIPFSIISNIGLLGASPNPNRQRRLLLKVFALADVVIYRTMSDRLHSDMFTFLADASDAFSEHFRPDLEALAERTGLPWTPGQLGPVVVIFQETQHTLPLDEPHSIASVNNNTCTDRLGSAEPSNERMSTLSKFRILVFLCISNTW